MSQTHADWRYLYNLFIYSIYSQLSSPIVRTKEMPNVKYVLLPPINFEIPPETLTQVIGWGFTKVCCLIYKFYYYYYYVLMQGKPFSSEIQ